MQRPIAVISIAALAACHSPRMRYVGSAGSIAVGALAIATAGPANNCMAPASSDDPLGFGAIGSELCELDQDARTGQLLLGTFLVLAGVVTAIRTYHRDERSRPEAPPPRIVIRDAVSIREPATTDPVLAQLTRQASLAARAGHCSAVKTIGQRIAGIDRDYRNGRFADDPAIAACL